MRMLAGSLILASGIACAVPAMWLAPAEAADIQEQIAAAKTPADHEAIATWYEDQAKEAEQKAAEHTKMAQAYKTGSFGHKTHFHEHCEVLAKNYTAEAKEYRALAAAHREKAKTGK
jgi:hypothetical protein